MIFRFCPFSIVSKVWPFDLFSSVTNSMSVLTVRSRREINVPSTTFVSRVFTNVLGRTFGRFRPFGRRWFAPIVLNDFRLTEDPRKKKKHQSLLLY